MTREIAAPADAVWAMVSDVTRMGEWSPENQGAEWLRGATAPLPGAKFKGRNRNGGRSWSTTAAVVDAVPGRRFSFRVGVGPLPVAMWSYDLEPTSTGCIVTESCTDIRPRFFKPIARLATGVADRATHNRAGMEVTLDRLAAAAEASAI
ncbi:MAG: SRPBCC family protein [Ilumatobacteraceae bacterium]